MRVGESASEREWLEGLRYEDKFACACESVCGDVPEEHDPSGVCKGLSRAPEPPLVEIVVVRR